MVVEMYRSLMPRRKTVSLLQLCNGALQLSELTTDFGQTMQKANIDFTFKCTRFFLKCLSEFVCAVLS